MSVYAKGWKAGWRPDPYLDFVEWANTHFRLTKESSVEPGKYRSSRTPWVEEVLKELSPQSPTQEVVVIKPTQAGYALAIDTPIPTPDGWVDMADIQVGDTVFDESGKQSKVLFVSEIFHDHECRKVTFSDGSEIVCDKDHLWTVTDTRNYKILKTKTLTTQEIMETAHDCYSKHAGKRNRYAIDVAGPIETGEKDFVISPYTLGCWLGDGSTSGSAITQCNGDATELMQHIIDSGHRAELVPSDKYVGDTTMIRVETKEKKLCQRGHIFDEVGRTKGRACKECHRQRYMFKKYGIAMDPVISESTFHSKLADLNLLYNKHIPSEYLRGSYQQRLELLQGLMDTDGTIDKCGRQEFSQVDNGITRSVYELIVSLGLKAVCKKVPAQKNKMMPHGEYANMQEQNRIGFYAYSDKPVFKLKRKLDRMVSPESVRRPCEVKRRRIINVEPVPSVPVKCIMVDSKSSLYLCGKSMIPTHNTTLANIMLCSVAHLYPGPCMLVQPTDDMVKKHSKKKLAPTVRAIPALKGIIKPVKSRDAGNTLLLKEFPGGSWTLTGSNSPVSARSDSIRYLILDDYDGFIQDAGGEGAPGNLFKKRTDAFGSKKKIYINSTPTTKGVSNIESEWEESSQGHFCVPCPHCKEYQFLVFGGKDAEHGIKFTRDDDGQITDVWYQCEHCQGRIEEWQKTDMLIHGKYIHDFPDRKKRGFKTNSLYSPLGWVSWAQVAEEFLKAAKQMKQGDPRGMKVWTNTRMAEVWEEDGERPEWQYLVARAEPYKILDVPEQARMITAGVDTQDNRLEVVIQAWGRDEQCWVIYYSPIYGDPDQPGVWQELDGLLTRTYSHPSGVQLHVESMGVDTGGHKTQSVYNYCRSRSPVVFALQGASTPGRPIIGNPSKQDIDYQGRKLKNGVSLYNIGTDVAKGLIYNRLKLTEPGPGYMHFPIGLPEEFYKQLAAEKLVTGYDQQGFKKTKWIKTRERNDVLDCFVYAYAAAVKAGLSRRNWDQIEQTFNAAASGASVPQQQKGRRIISRGIS